MTRKEKILAYVQAKNKAVTTKEIADDLGILRNNVSKELNVLVRAGQLSKIAGRPVKYQSLTDKTDTVTAETVSKIPDPVEPPLKSSIFDTMIGQKDSLKTQIEQAKAAILYPPHGLNVLITGPTGSGKTYFANAMHQFAINQAMVENKNFVTFNCADYAHNPQLLMSHLFGYVKGAFTGAQEDRDGLIQKADGGILFLDEVHRLPPEGQEMIFYFMDHGTYSKLGEITKVHHADVRLICATTEDPESSLLKTFVRRIPITIQMPQFEARSVREQLALLKRLLTLEANRTQKNITVTEDVVKALLGSVTFGNVGQLKSNIQLVCAQGFLNSVDQDEQINLKFEQLPQNIKDGMSRLASDRVRLGKLSQLLEPVLLIQPDGAAESINESDRYELPYNLYEIIGNKAALLKEEGLEQGAINNFIMTDINVHLKSFYRDNKILRTEKNLNELVDQDTLQLTKDIMQMLKKDCGYHVGENFIYAMSLHLSSFIKRVQSGRPMREVSDDLVAMVKDYPADLKLAEKIKAMLEDHYDFIVPASEVYYLAVLLISLNSVPKHGKVGVVVAAHGNHTASSMVQVVTELLNVDNLAAFDMSLEMSPTVALNEIIAKVKQVDRGNGVLLLVDMGSLSTFSAKITEETDIKVKTIDMVTTAMVLEAARKTALIDSDLELVYHELNEFNGYSRKAEEPTQGELEDVRQRAILALCSTGKGTAEKIKQMLDEILADQLIDDVSVLTMSVVGMNDKISELNEEYRIIATTGIADPNLGVPYISLEELFQGDRGKRQLIEHLENSQTWYVESKTPAPKVDQTAAANYLEQYYTFINPKKVIGVLWQYCDLLAKERQLKLTDARRLALIMHLGGAIERVLLSAPVTLTEEQAVEFEQSDWPQALKLADEYLEAKLNLKFPSAEAYYIAKLVDTEMVES
ncbi:sigma-54-dependent transcriptional regulator [Ligilactobacillus animalis]|jgi:transcriptional regulatory protein LevR/transcriptional regulator with AAA-type ATPase domain|uniref:sigma-54-dependent transcriptional regulator n=1 Tax=Ligilactobacillus animalis TaxID=1605 RepID=UPI002591D2E5|nr:sigma-54-dependent transcriptional regulator [Ligilactobacillus animalis]